jgi:hypothetical protein
VAVVMCAIVVKMLREERRRSDARVEALLAIADEPQTGGLQNVQTVETLASVSTAARPNGPMRAEREREPRRPLPPQPDPPVPQHDDLELNPVAPVTGVTGLFAERETRSPWGRRLAAAAGCAAVLTAGIIAFSSWPGDPDTSGATSAASPVPLELLSLRHTADTKALTITGLVQNPRGGAGFTGVTAVAFLFAEDGGFISSGRAPLDFTRLEPGQESPFVVQVPITTAVARYRVSFRGENGGVIAHVDRRNAGPVAQKAQQD